jgi:hypothetical protein
MMERRARPVRDVRPTPSRAAADSEATSFETQRHHRSTAGMSKIATQRRPTDAARQLRNDDCRLLSSSSSRRMERSGAMVALIGWFLRRNFLRLTPRRGRRRNRA